MPKSFFVRRRKIWELLVKGTFPTAFPGEGVCVVLARIRS